MAIQRPSGEGPCTCEGAGSRWGGSFASPTAVGAARRRLEQLPSAHLPSPTLRVGLTCNLLLTEAKPFDPLPTHRHVSRVRVRCTCSQTQARVCACTRTAMASLGGVSLAIG